MYTLDQIAYLLSIDIEKLKDLVFFPSINRLRRKPSGQVMRAVNIMPSSLHDHPEWRIPETEFHRYLRTLDMKIYVRKASSAGSAIHGRIRASRK